MFVGVVSINQRTIVTDSQHNENTESVTSNADSESTKTLTSSTSEGDAAKSSTPQQELLDRLGTTLSPDLLVQALTHRSFSHEHEGAPNYERLEFLGDAVLEFVSTETLYRVHPDMNEGQLAKMRAMAVSEKALSQIAREKLQVGPYILLGHGEAESGGADKSSILCDIVESLIGATFIEHGIDEARKVVHHLVDDELKKVATEGPALDWKTSLTVKAHGMGLEDPRYRMAVSGPEYAQVFTARAVVGENDEVLGVGTGSSKRKAQLAAAREAWHELDDHPSKHQAKKHHHDGNKGNNRNRQ
ncbi:ribonuclease III [Bifidobacterium sp. ESL0682]|uniref:ribonuclease III n=1 Tax=Bifidobacterium sp. ESL0682 TaxID=2983212 RepID=UPI0023F9E0C8|nr:ribonuclease III [Bifidobacterium sp. ESL0682]WEV42774.1 ribonuclease III [Bifidobacterium sp. ESL0682]